LAAIKQFKSVLGPEVLRAGRWPERIIDIKGKYTKKDENHYRGK
jgi:hypothetical protein